LTLDLFEERLCNLEKEVESNKKEARLWKITALIILVFTVIITFHSKTGTVNALVGDQQDNIVFRDPMGNMRIFLGVTAGSPALDLYDSNGNPKIRLAVSSDGAPVYEMYDSNRKVRIGATVLPNGETSLVMPDANGIPRFGILISSDGTPVLSILDRSGKGKAKITVLQNGIPTLTVSDGKGKVIWRAP